MMEIGTRLLQQWDACPDPEQTWRSMEDLSISGEELRQRGTEDEITEDEITEDEIGEIDANAMGHRSVEPRLNVILHRRDPNAPHEEYDDNRRERSRSRDDGQGPPRVASTESQATTEEAVEEAASGAEGHGEGHGHPSHEHQSTPEERDRANLQQRWRTLDRRLNRPRERSDRSSEGSSPPRPLSELGDLVRRMSEIDQRLQQPPGRGGSSSSRAAGGLSNEARTRRNQDQADLHNPMNAAAVWPDSPGEDEVEAALAAEDEIEALLEAERPPEENERRRREQGNAAAREGLRRLRAQEAEPQSLRSKQRRRNQVNQSRITFKTSFRTNGETWRSR